MNYLSDVKGAVPQEQQAQSRLVGLLRRALPDAEIMADFRVSTSPQYRSDIAIPQARFVVEIKRNRSPHTLRDAQYQMAHLAPAGWTGILVFSDEVESAAPELIERVRAALPAE